jgi:hypothetical protein
MKTVNQNTMIIYCLLLLFFSFLELSSGVQDLLLWYRFSPNSLNYASSGSGVADATLQNGVQTQAVSYGNAGLSGALSLNSASSQYLQINNFTTGNNGLSFAFWFKSSNNSMWARVFDFGNGITNNNLLFAPNPFEFHCYVGSTAYVMSSSPMCNDNVWCFIALTMTYSTSFGSTWTLYVNGSVHSISTNKPYPPPVTRTHNYLGKSNWNYDPYYRGMLGEFQLYSTALTQGDVEILYYGSHLSDTKVWNLIGASDCTGMNFFIV